MWRLKRYLLGLSLALNVLSSAVLGGDPTITVSARAGKARLAGRATGRIVCAVLGALDFAETSYEDHCEKALRHDRERRELGHHESYPAKSVPVVE